MKDKVYGYVTKDNVKIFEKLGFDIGEYDEKEERYEITCLPVENTNLFGALASFQGDLKAIEKDSSVDFTTKAGDRVNFSYTSLGKIMEFIYPLLGRHQLSTRWVIDKERGIECIVSHKSGGNISSGYLPLDLTKVDMKDVGGQITYGRRYTLGLVLGVATEEDKDALLQEKNTSATKKIAIEMVETKIKNAKTIESLDTTFDFIKGHLDQAQKFETGLSDKPSQLGLKVTEYEELLKKCEDKKLQILNAQKNG